MEPTKAASLGLNNLWIVLSDIKKIHVNAMADLNEEI